MKSREAIERRFRELEQQMLELREKDMGNGLSWYADDEWQSWATSVANLFEAAFGRHSVHVKTFARFHESRKSTADVESAKGVFRAAKSDFDGGYILSMEREISGEIFGDFVALAKEALAAGNHVAATVLACAALEDALKRFSVSNGLAVDGKTMTEVVNALKAKGYVAGAQKSLLEAMPKVRNQAMHGDWDKLTASDAGSVIGFTEQFLLSSFS